ncbi:nucleoside deaminase [Desulfobacula sp.]|uniref:nucleoside deaminase n=1 Tax=Desulfobacula sp. TaxID=2593537 RepID=UPI002639179A|nr:nucleoside deaminase [Desulfobacula sp.]
MEYKYYMGLALEQAKKAFDRGEFPVGCVIVQDEKIIASGARQGTTQDKPFFSEIEHAEIRALKYLETIDAQFDPVKSVLFCTMEPCLMCFGAIILSGIKKIVYAYEDPMGGGTTCDLKKLPFLYQKCGIDIVPGVLRQKSLDLFYNFFKKEDNLYWKNSYLETYTLGQKKQRASK